MSEELKPCGSCGSVEAEIGIIGGATFWVECSACGACSSSHDDEYDAIAAWNRRPIEDKLQARIDALEWLREVEKTNRGMDEWHPDWKKRSKEANRRRSDARAAMRRMWWSAYEAVES